MRFDAATESVLLASDYLSRDYETADGRFANFYVGYYATQRNGATYHSPLNCLPGSGWTLNDPGRVEIKPADGSSAASQPAKSAGKAQPRARRAAAQKALEKDALPEEMPPLTDPALPAPQRGPVGGRLPMAG